MNDQEKKFYQEIRNVPAEKSLAANKIMTNIFEERFKAENAARMASIARLNTMREQKRSVLAKDPAYAGVLQEAGKLLSTRREKPVLAKPFIPAGPKSPRLRLGSLHLVDTAPFIHLSSAFSTSISGTPIPISVNANGATGNMSFSMMSGYAGDSSILGCWSMIGQIYTCPTNLNGTPILGALMKFSAYPSFNWQAQWISFNYRTAVGIISIGQVVNQLDQEMNLISSPVSAYYTLANWDDTALFTDPAISGQNTSYPLSSTLFVEPGFLYDCRVVISANIQADGTNPSQAASDCLAEMNANVSALMFDTF